MPASGYFSAFDNPDAAAWAGMENTNGVLQGSELPDVAVIGGIHALIGAFAAEEFPPDTAFIDARFVAGAVYTSESPDISFIVVNVPFGGPQRAPNPTALSSGTIGQLLAVSPGQVLSVGMPAIPLHPPSGDITPYLDEVTSEHIERPKFIATLETLVQPLADKMLLEWYFFDFYDLDIAIDAQLDAVGIWVGRNRYLQTETEGIAILDDDHYRLLLYATVAANHWDGTIPGAYAALDVLFKDTGYSFLIQDWGNGQMAIAMIGPRPPDPITEALFTSGELDLKPAGIMLWHVLPSEWPAGPGGTPLFGFDCEDSAISGYDVGAWAVFFAPE